MTTGVRLARAAAGLLALGLSVGYLTAVADAEAFRLAGDAVRTAPLALFGAVLLYGVAFGLRAVVWRRVLPALPLAQSWAALHVALLGNHVLPLRLGEPLRVLSVLRRTELPTQPVIASAVALRLADVGTVLLLAVAVAPGLVADLLGGWIWPVGLALAAATVACWRWVHWLAARSAVTRPLHAPGPFGWGGIVVAWLLEAAVLWAAAAAVGIELSPAGAVAVTAVTIAAQTVAVTPGGFGSYEAAATAALVLLGAPAEAAFAAALVSHAVKTAYALVTGGLAMIWPAPGYLGRLRLPRRPPARPDRRPLAAGAPVVVVIPAYDEQATVGQVIARLPDAVAGRPVRTVVVDDGSTDATAARAVAAGAEVVRLPVNQGLGAALRRGLAEAVARRPACVVYLDADDEYPAEAVTAVAAPVLAGTADYVVGSRFAGQPRRMRPHRRVGNAALTAWLRWLTRRGDLTDGQSGMRAFSAEAAAHAEVIHDYNYAQVLTLDLLGKGYRYAEVPISYGFRRTGSSFVRLGRYLRAVVPAVYRELNAPAPPLVLDDVAGEAVPGR